MFNFESLGYNRQEVDRYIAQLKAELVQKKLNLLESEKKVLGLKQKKEDVESKEKNILKALKVLEKSQKEQEESMKNLYALKIEQNDIIYDRIKKLFNRIEILFPEIQNNFEIKKGLNEIETLIDEVKTNPGKRLNIEKDPMRELLSKMQEYKRQKEAGIKTVKIERNNIHLYDNANNVDEFLAVKPEDNKLYKNIEIQSNGFDLKEAVNPKDNLDEIMRAFDFFNEGEN